MEDWYPVRLAPRDGTPVILWIEDQDAPPAYPVTVGVWERDDITGRRHWRVFGLATVHTPTSTSTSSAGGRCLAFGRVKATDGTDRATKKKGATNL
jgi:hypothetical protein